MEDGDCGAPTVPAPLNHEALVTAGGVLANDRIASSPASDMANYPDVEVSVINNKTANNTSKTLTTTTTSNNSDSECNVVDSKLTTVTTIAANSNNTHNSDDVDVGDSNTAVIPISDINNVKVNGQSDRVHSDEHEDEYTSDEEALVIDEECKKVVVEEDSVKSAALITRKRVRSPSPRANFKGFKKRIIAKSIHYRKVVNDLRNASFYIDLKDNKDGTQSEQQQHLEVQDQRRCSKPSSEVVIRTTELPRHKPTNSSAVRPVTRRNATNKRRPSQKLTEYAQYLGLQPAVKFKCVKCSESSFQSLSSLNDHQRYCLSQPASSSSALTKSSGTSGRSGGTGSIAGAGGGGPTSTNFRVTRKVFLCSSCGTYYENCNLFLHMREVHRRYICLYCLGMFSLPEKLSHHLVTKHNCSPHHYASAEDFLSSYTDSCFLVCCHCERVFSERDNFFDHICVERRTASDKVCASCGVKGTSAHLSTCKGGGAAGLEVPSTSSTSVATTKSSGNTSSSGGGSNNSKCPVQHHRPTTSRQSKVSKAAAAAASSCSKTVSLVEHVTADSPSTSLLSPAHAPDKEPETDVQEADEAVATEEMNAAEHFMAAAASSPETNTREQETVVEEEQQQQQQAETTSNEADTEDKSEAMCIEGTSTESEPVQETSEHCKPVDQPTENVVTEEHTDETQTKAMSPEPESTATVVPDEQSAERDAEEEQQQQQQEDTQSQTKSSEVNVDEVDERKSDKEEPVLSESSDESVVSEAEREESQQSDTHMVAEPKEQDTADTNGSPSPTPADTGDMNQSAEPQEAKDESEDAKENSDQHEAEEEDDEDENMKEEEEQQQQQQEQEQPVEQETRKVPKVRLKLPPQAMVYSENDSDDSEKLTMEVEDNGDSDEGSKTADDSQDKAMNGYEEHSAEEEYVPVAGEDVPIVELELEQPLDKFTMESLLRRCLGATIPTCVYCNHARKIAVNGKQLGLHAIAEHRFAATVNSITAEELIPASFVTRIKECLREVESVYFCLDVNKPVDDEPVVVTSYKRVYECFQCRYVTTIHKELYLHNRKMHAKTILLCIMCKSNFYSYSELICHLCPGNYVLHSETMFRCCMCSANDLPSAFRLMVHLRKRHHTCDVCLEGCHNQSKLSNHVWKHKLHHLCYRCGIAYRNKPDITKHLFWKHGTESLLCKRCLQKKWPHVYHFCIPPAAFVCEECSHSFTKAVYLKVHKRLHSHERPHACTEDGCTQRFISKKLQLKHEARHREPVPLEQAADDVQVAEDTQDTPMDTEQSDSKPAVAEVKPEDAEHAQENVEEPKKSLIDVYDLPALNLSESDSDSEEEKPQPTTVTVKPEHEDETKVDTAVNDKADEKKIDMTNSEPVPMTLDEDQKPVPILDGIWDNFKNYQATIEKRDGFSTEPAQTELKCEDMKVEPAEAEEEYPVPDLDVIMADHDYCLPPEPPQLAEPVEGPVDKVKMDADSGMDHDYCTVGNTQEPPSNNNQTRAAGEAAGRLAQDPAEKKKSKSPKKKSTKRAGSSSSSDSSSDSESSSCTCGSNCSCSSSSGSSSSSSSSSDSDSSSSEGKRRLQARRERRKERAAKRKKESETTQPAAAAVSNTSPVDVVATEDPPAAPPLLPPIIELPIEESDLDTDETETDEDFYDEHPQRLANKIMAEKRNQLALLAAVAPVNNGGVMECSPPSTPNLPEPDPPAPAPPAAVEVTPTSTTKKKVKAKKRKKKSRSSTPKHEPHNIPEYHQQVNHRHRRRVMSPAVVRAVPSVVATVPLVQPIVIQSPQIVRVPMVETPKSHHHQQQQLHNHGSGSETDSNVRSSKRRRVPNKFYGYSSDEDAHDKPTPGSTVKWRKSEITTASTTVHHVTGSPQFVPPITIKNIPSPAPIVEPVRAPVIHHDEVVEDSDSDEEEEEEVAPVRKSSSESSDNERNDDSDSDTGQLHISQPAPAPQPPPPAPPVGYSAAAMAHHQAAAAAAAAGGERSNENLYCYCQCPYDEVSEMIACDGKDCAIEWFHFECVGIMVPPKGKWFCPDCRRKTTTAAAAGGGMAPGRSDFLQT